MRNLASATARSQACIYFNAHVINATSVRDGLYMLSYYDVCKPRERLGVRRHMNIGLGFVSFLLDDFRKASFGRTEKIKT